MNARESANQAIQEMVHRETRAWDHQDAEALVDLFHPDIGLAWPPIAHDHPPETWILEFGRYDGKRWKDEWERLFATHRLVHNQREIRKVVVSAEGDAGLAVVDIDTLKPEGDGLQRPRPRREPAPRLLHVGGGFGGTAEDCRGGDRTFDSSSTVSRFAQVPDPRRFDPLARFAELADAKSSA